MSEMNKKITIEGLNQTPENLTFILTVMEKIGMNGKIKVSFALDKKRNRI